MHTAMNEREKEDGGERDILIDRWLNSRLCTERERKTNLEEEEEKKKKRRRNGNFAIHFNITLSLIRNISQTKMKKSKQ